MYFHAPCGTFVFYVVIVKWAYKKKTTRGHLKGGKEEGKSTFYPTSVLIAEVYLTFKGTPHKLPNKLPEKIRKVKTAAEVSAQTHDILCIEAKRRLLVTNWINGFNKFQI